MDPSETGHYRLRARNHGEKNQVKQVNNGQECGITVKDYLDFQKNDTIEAFSVTSVERSI